MPCWLRQQPGQNVLEMISLLGVNMEFIMSLQVYGWLQNIINSLKSAISNAAAAPITLPSTEVGKF
jgi:hypothetical protein